MPQVVYLILTIVCHWNTHGVFNWNTHGVFHWKYISYIDLVIFGCNVSNFIQIGVKDILV